MNTNNNTKRAQPLAASRLIVPPPSRPTREPRRLDESERIEVAARYLAGWTCQQLADEFGCTDMTVWRTLRRLGVQSRPRGRRPA